MEIFISSSPDNTLIRKFFMLSSNLEWRGIKDAHLKFSTQSFSERGRWAESKSIGFVYCLADDDCLPEPTLDLNRIEELFRINPAYGIIALADVHGNHKRDWIVESTCVGGIRFIRKGCVTEFPENFSGDDAEYYELMTKAGYKSGICTEFTRLHMGVFHSLWQKEGGKCPK